MQRTYILLASFLAGLGSSLFIETPFGRVAMFDLACYFLGPFLYIINFKKYSKAERRILMLAVLWILGAIYSNWWRQEPFDAALKGNAIVFNVWCMIVVGIWLLEKDYRSWLWFVVGNGISCVISLYYFQNGALLSFAERSGFIGQGGLQFFLEKKQVYPIYIQSIIYAALFPLVVELHLPWFMVIVFLILSAFFLLINGGSRSAFGLNLLSSFFCIGYAYFRRFTNLLINKFVLLCVTGIIAVSIIFSIYRDLALQGDLGQEEYDKYYREMVDSESGVLGSRDDIIRAWPFLQNHPIVGAGSSSIDRWGYMTNDVRLPGHSALVGAWVQNGILGLVFWGYVLWVIMLFVQKRVMCFQSLAPFTVMKVVSMVWAILFSPFGGYRGEVSILIALCVVAQDEQWLKRVSMKITTKKRMVSHDRCIR